MDRMDRVRRRGLGSLVTLLTVAFLVSIVHYVDNVANYTSYPQPGEGDPPAPSRELITVSWFMFTAFGAAGLWSFARAKTLSAALCITVYSFSGLVGIGHYLSPGATSMVWWRQAHVIADILCGLVLLGFAAWAVAARPRGTTSAS